MCLARIHRRCRCWCRLAAKTRCCRCCVRHWTQARRRCEDHLFAAAVFAHLLRVLLLKEQRRRREAGMMRMVLLMLRLIVMNEACDWPVVLEDSNSSRGRGCGGGGGELFLVVVFVVLLGHGEAERASHASLGASTPKVAATEVVQIGRMDGPVVALAVRAAAGLHEAVVERQVVAYGVAPAGAARMKVRVVVEYPLVDVGEDEALVGRAQDGERDQADVAVRRLRLVAALRHASTAAASRTRRRRRRHHARVNFNIRSVCIVDVVVVVVVARRRAHHFARLLIVNALTAYAAAAAATAVVVAAVAAADATASTAVAGDLYLWLACVGGGDDGSRRRRRRRRRRCQHVGEAVEYVLPLLAVEVWIVGSGVLRNGRRRGSIVGVVVSGGSGGGCEHARVRVHVCSCSRCSRCRGCHVKHGVGRRVHEVVRLWLCGLCRRRRKENVTATVVVGFLSQ